MYITINSLDSQEKILLSDTRARSFFPLFMAIVTLAHKKHGDHWYHIVCVKTIQAKIRELCVSYQVQERIVQLI